jgi:hypothetical protein
MANSIYWYDYETFGINPRSDRLAQFGGIRTDEDLNIISEPLVIYCKPADDMLPDPYACLVTGITPQRAQPNLSPRSTNSFPSPAPALPATTASASTMNSPAMPCTGISTTPTRTNGSTATPAGI